MTSLLTHSLMRACPKQSCQVCSLYCSGRLLDCHHAGIWAAAGFSQWETLVVNEVKEICALMTFASFLLGLAEILVDLHFPLSLLCHRCYQAASHLVSCSWNGPSCLLSPGPIMHFQKPPNIVAQHGRVTYEFSWPDIDPAHLLSFKVSHRL